MSELNCSVAAKKAGISDIEMENLITVAKKASNIGGTILMEHYGSLCMVKNKGRVGDLVTNADLTAERKVLDYLNKLTPQISIHAEESGNLGPQNSLVWCVDPLDGTTNFAHGYPFFATSIGLTWKNEPILGAISIPMLNETYWGAPGIGVFCNSKKITVSSAHRLIDSLLVTGFAYDRHNRLDNNYAEFCWLTNKTRGVRRGGAAAVDLAFIACGRLDGYWERGLSKWDLAAGVALVELAGGKISDYKTNKFDISTGRVLATTPGIESELKAELSKVMPLEGKYFDSPNLKNVGS